MEPKILFTSLIMEKIGLPVPYALGETLLEKLVSPHLVHSWLVMAILIIVPMLTLGRMEMVPGKGQNFWEAIVGNLEEFMAENMGREGARMMFPMLATLALYILVANLLGLIPGFKTPTSNLNITLGCALIVFCTTHILGLKFHGIRYIKHFMGPIPWLIPLMLPIEIISHFARVLSLSIRLFGNMMAKDVLLGILFILAGIYFAPLPIMFLAVFLAIVQALVFLLLSVLYFSAAMEHAH